MKKICKMIYAFLITSILTFTSLDLKAADQPVYTPFEHADLRCWEISSSGEQITFPGRRVTFEINPIDAYKLARFGEWRHSDNPVILSNCSPSDYDYLLWNSRNNDYLEVNLAPSHLRIEKIPPRSFYTFYFITDISNPTKNYYSIYLNSYTVWRMNASDRDILSDWRAGDHIIVGLNNDPSSSKKFPNILINANLNTYVNVYCTHPHD